jgi:glucose-1-phosphate thymidylyltransferase
MKALVLGAGYAVRMRPLTLNNAKPLLLVGGRPMIDYVVEKIDEISQVDCIFVVVNERFFDDFRKWAKRAPTSKPLKLVNDGSTCDEDRLGAVADINFVVEKEKISDDFLVVGGDNLFDFGLRDFVSFFEEKGTSVALYPCGNLESVKRLSNVELDADGRIVFFEEKPENPRSDLAAICIYLFEKSSLPLLKKYFAEGGKRDAPGYYIQWLHKQIPVYGKIVRGTWYDIGNEETYREADRRFSARRPHA